MIGDPEPEGEPLTSEEVAALGDGTSIIVKWSGGNGPHRYTVAHLGDDVVAATDDELVRGRLDIEKSLVPPIGFVGRERYHTRVWRS